MYLDGHFIPYSGHAAYAGRGHSTLRHLVIPGHEQFWAHDSQRPSALGGRSGGGRLVLSQPPHVKYWETARFFLPGTLIIDGIVRQGIFAKYREYIPYDQTTDGGHHPRPQRSQLFSPQWDRLSGPVTRDWLSVADTILPWDQDRSRIAPSVLLLMLVINVLTHRNPLYAVETWVATLPLDLLWGDGIQASQFNDDALGRVLEDVAVHGPQLLATLGMRMQGVHQTLSDWLHSDTSAFSLMGDYPSATTGPTAPVELTWGHSKDHRPDLRQIMMGVTMDAEGCVLAGTMLSGNTSD